MLKKTWALLLIALLASTVLVGCGDDDPADVTDDFLTSEEVFTAVATAGADYLNTNAPGVNGYAYFDGIGFENFTILDFRSAADFAISHIENAVNVTLGNLVAELGTRAYPDDKDFMCVCYTGQSAGHAVAALRMLGYTAYSYKWGMSGWHTDLDGSWEGNAGPVNGAAMADAGVAIETTVNDKTGTFAWPTMTEEVETATEAVTARVEAALTAGFKGKMFADIALTLDDYYIVNYWTLDQYTGDDADTPGHIPGAFQFTPAASLAMDQDLEFLPTDKPIIVYCWTSQTSSQVTFYLNCLGYEAYSLKFGANNLFWNELGSHQWVDGLPEYPLVP
jgi:rhodanese-related sulfurtransferase